MTQENKVAEIPQLVSNKIAAAESMTFNRKPSLTSDYQQGAYFGYSLAQQEIAEAKKEIERLKSLFLDLIDVAHRQAACKNCIEELNKFKTGNNL